MTQDWLFYQGLNEFVPFMPTTTTLLAFPMIMESMYGDDKFDIAFRALSLVYISGWYRNAVLSKVYLMA